MEDLNYTTHIMRMYSSQLPFRASFMWGHTKLEIGLRGWILDAGDSAELLEVNMQLCNQMIAGEAPPSHTHMLHQGIPCKEQKLLHL